MLEDHDTKDTCLMNYPTSSPEKFKPMFCGKCNLKLRGVNIRGKRVVNIRGKRSLVDILPEHHRG